VPCHLLDDDGNYLVFVIGAVELFLVGGGSNRSTASRRSIAMLMKPIDIH
jgi:hypothetical protein